MFSAAVAALVAVTLPDLNGNTQERSTFFLENIYQLMANPNVSRPLTPVEPPTSHPKHLIWVNSLWFLSLAISLTCAMLATLFQQWLRGHLAITQAPSDSPQGRARRHAFFAHGVKKWHLSWWLEALPTLLHLSFFVFFSGLLILSFNVNHPVFAAIVGWVVLSGVAYIFITIMPFIWTDVPYFTPLSSIFGLSWHVEKKLRKVTRRASWRDNLVLLSMLNSFTEDDELGQFFDKIPGFFHSNKVFKSHWRFGLDKIMTSALLAFAKHTLTNNIVSQWNRAQRFVISVKAADAAHLPIAALEILKDIFPLDRIGVIEARAIGRSLVEKENESKAEIGLCAQGVVARVIANAFTEFEQPNDEWIALAKDQLGMNLSNYDHYNRDNVLLTNLIHITFKIFDSDLWDERQKAEAASYILPSLSNFDPYLVHLERLPNFRSWYDRASQIDWVPEKVLDKFRSLYDRCLSQDSHASRTEPSMPTAEPSGQSVPTTTGITGDSGPDPGSTSRIASASVSDRDPPGVASLPMVKHLPVVGRRHVVGRLHVVGRRHVVGRLHVVEEAATMA